MAELEAADKEVSQVKQRKETATAEVASLAADKSCMDAEFMFYRAQKEEEMENECEWKAFFPLFGVRVHNRCASFFSLVVFLIGVSSTTSPCHEMFGIIITSRFVTPDAQRYDEMIMVLFGLTPSCPGTN